MDAAWLWCLYDTRETDNALVSLHIRRSMAMPYEDEIRSVEGPDARAAPKEHSV